MSGWLTELRGISIDASRAHPGTLVAPSTFDAMLAELLDAGVGCAPHVLLQLGRRLAGDAVTIRQTAEHLDARQRHGLAPLPELLPLVEEIEATFRGVVFAPRDHDLLLAAALTLDDALAPLLAVDGRSACELANGPVGVELRIGAGRFCFFDPRLAIWIRHTSSAGRQAAVHATLADARGSHARSADTRSAGARAWHRSRASLQHAPHGAGALIEAARACATNGHSVRAFAFAREAASHTTGEDRADALRIAGTAALGAGFAHEAARRLERARRVAGGGALSRDGAALLFARTLTEGVVPDTPLSHLYGRTGGVEGRQEVIRALALGAVLCAERGDRRGARSRLYVLRDPGIGADRDVSAAAASLCALIGGEGEPPDAPAYPGRGPVSGILVSALRAALTDDIDRGLRMLRSPASTHGADPLLAGLERSPLMRATLTVLETLLLFWRGDVGLARDRIVDAARELPVAAPFGGLGVVLARRLDIAVRGAPGPVALALTAALPSEARMDLLVDRSLQSLLAGALDDADATRRLWWDRGAPQPVLRVPGLDEMPVPAPRRGQRKTSVEPLDLRASAALKRRATSLSTQSWRTQLEELALAAREVRSPFARAGVEAALSTQYAVRDEHAAARAHLRAALRLFEVAGATAWARATQRRLDRWDAQGGPGCLPPDTLAASRRAWATLLTARELDVAMRAVDGATNRDIATELGVSVRTVEVHLGRTFAKLGVRTRVELTVLSRRTERHG